MQKTLVNGQMVCSSCHNQHSQQAAPFDPSAPPYVSGSGAGRHFMIADNSADQLCLDCHASRNVSSSLGGSHPVGVPIPATGDYKNPSLMPLSGSSNVLCDTCHDVHFAAETDGSLLRTTDRRAACTDCHTLADTTTPAAHMNALTSALWPGGQYGTTFPAITDTTLRGGCENCHNAHGWPVAGNPSSNYDKMLVDTEENLCLTCHDSDGPAAKDVKTDFAKTLHHPVSDTDPLRSPGRSVECNDCHNAHKAQNGTRNYSATATSTRNNVSNAPTLLGASGVAVDYSTLGNFVAPVR
jgi:predicted CXXCH cytochrome family protein